MWEGIGITSYLLINFWYTRIQATKAAILALTMNRVGDMCLTIGFFALLALIGSLDYSSIASTTPYLNETAISIIVLLLLIGASAKSAQLFLFTWLPASMEGKTTAWSFLYLLKNIIILIFGLIVCFHHLYHSQIDMPLINEYPT